ncbi:MAG: group II truncated hemoglobin [Gammaproteobacteria bacterium]|nr:group II truncated hemoglobin [Gammaproteobacteria bacterium]
MNEKVPGQQQDTPYARIGGEAGTRELVDRFYDAMDRLDKAATIRAMHPEDLAESRDKLYLFLSGWLGGPALYNQIHGHPRLRYRHLPFSIGEREAAEWLLCMATALEEMQLDDFLRERLMQSFAMTAHHMRNRAEHGHEQGQGDGNEA